MFLWLEKTGNICFNDKKNNFLKCGIKSNSKFKINKILVLLKNPKILKEIYKRKNIKEVLNTIFTLKQILTYKYFKYIMKWRDTTDQI